MDAAWLIGWCCYSSTQYAYSLTAHIFCQLLKGGVEITNIIFDLSMFSFAFYPLFLFHVFQSSIIRC